MRLLFYKLPSESGENVIVTESYAYADSEIAVLLDDADLNLDFYDIYATAGDDFEVTLVDIEEGDLSPYILVDTEKNIEGTLPFASEGHAFRFLEELVKWQDFVNTAYDE